MSWQPPLTHDVSDVDRWVPEVAKNPRRSPFERDRARIVHSSALRRLGAKTQVLAPSTDDFVRTRLTHSLEVAQVGRELAKQLGCDPDVVDTACLAHDLGHPPFGHNGEAALAEVAEDAGGFEGNAQTLRILTRLEPKIFRSDGRCVGLNLTRASLDASAKYPWRRIDAPRRKDGRRSRKFGVYEDDLAVFSWLREGAPEGASCLEAQVMDLADDVAYCVHDVEDAVVGWRIDLEDLTTLAGQQRVVDQVRDWYDPAESDDELGAALQRLLGLRDWVNSYDGTRADLARVKDMTSQLIGRFSGAAVDATRAVHGNGELGRYDARLEVPAGTRAEIAVLKGIAALYVMAPRENEPVYRNQRRVVRDLVHVILERPEAVLEPAFLTDYREAADDAARLRVAVDQVASLTDLSALAWHARLIRPVG
ncbi:deoxyguanosinetriphosphate triphosphohydrolase [Serinibacter salmoneus]|uniref:Deoxyguanosinetriphosphate triphosphohydrolase-like protein n=1 Tax=Serinibacter salmoneus TaxID=556530 RepID=A0A2A9D0K2_9MICO|nr:deoxyguanosinetriphosphate triphosphohydrolase [Serinibacter salmoneus]PFG19916.1 dGTPase [Serinibacter salmoneus]